MDRRRAPRIGVSTLVLTLAAGARVPARIRDMSRIGCRIDTPVRLRRGEEVVLELALPDRDLTIAGRIVRATARSAGVAFHRPLSAGAVASVGWKPLPAAANVVRLHPPPH